MSKRHWGRWEFDTRKPLALTIQVTPNFEYDIVLSQCQSHFKQENWLYHLSEKRWVTLQDLADLRRAFEELTIGGVKGK